MLLSSSMERDPRASTCEIFLASHVAGGFLQKPCAMPGALVLADAGSGSSLDLMSEFFGFCTWKPLIRNTVSVLLLLPAASWLVHLGISTGMASLQHCGCMSCAERYYFTVFCDDGGIACNLGAYAELEHVPATFCKCHWGWS